MEWVLSLCLLYANTPKSTTQKPSPLGEGGRREPDGRGELTLKPRLPPNQRTYPSDCEAGARDEPSPLGEGGPR